MVSKLLSDKTSLRGIQQYVVKVCAERGFANDPVNKMILLTEEVGELAKAFRKKRGMKFSATTTQTELEEEIADVLITLLGFANTLDIDVYDAFVAKEEENRKRVWQ